MEQKVRVISLSTGQMVEGTEEEVKPTMNEWSKRMDIFGPIVKMEAKERWKNPMYINKEALLEDLSILRADILESVKVNEKAGNHITANMYRMQANGLEKAMEIVRKQEVKWL